MVKLLLEHHHKPSLLCLTLDPPTCGCLLNNALYWISLVVRLSRQSLLCGEISLYYVLVVNLLYKSQTKIRQ